MGKTFTVDILSPSSIEKLKKNLAKYKDGLIKKTELLVQELSKIGLETIDVKLSESRLGHHVTVQTDSETIPHGTVLVIIATGDTKFSENYEPFNTLLAIEFGAGIHFNHNENPKASELGYGVGSFPEQTHAFQEEGWYFWDEEKQKYVHSFGVQATMPLYNATQEMKLRVKEVARKIFVE